MGWGWGASWARASAWGDAELVAVYVDGRIDGRIDR